MKAKRLKMENVLVLHGPNLNLLGEREPEIYGDLTLDELNRRIQQLAHEWSIQIRVFQSNSEGRLMDLLHDYRKWAHGVVFNPAAYSHYSYALRDAVAALPCPTVEVHLSKIHKREAFRKISVIAPVCVQQISGLGWRSYAQGIRYLMQHR